MLRSFGAKKEETDLIELDTDIFCGVLFWIVAQTDNTKMLTSLAKQIQPDLTPVFLKVFDETNTLPNEKNGKAEKIDSTPLLSADIKIQIQPTKEKIILSDIQEDLFGLIELAATRGASELALKLLSINQNKRRVNLSIQSLGQIAARQGLSPILDALNKEEGDNQIIDIETTSDLKHLTGNQLKIYNLAKIGTLTGLENFQNRQKPKDTKDFIDDEPDFLAVMDHAYAERNFVLLHTLIQFYLKQERSLALFQHAVKKQNRGLFYILLFATQQLPFLLAPHFANNLPAFHKVLKLPLEEKGILSCMIRQGLYGGKKDRRTEAEKTLHKTYFSESKVTVDLFLELYFDYIKICPHQSDALKTALKLKPPTIKSEVQLTQWLFENHLLKPTFVQRIGDDALRFGIELKIRHSLPSQDKKGSGTLTPIFNHYFGPPANLIMQALDSKDQTSFAVASKSCHKAFETYYSSPKISMINQFLEHLNDSVLKYTFRKRFWDLNWRKKLLFFSYLLSVPAAGSAIGGTIVQNNIVTELQNILSSISTLCFSQGLLNSGGALSQCNDFAQYFCNDPMPQSVIDDCSMLNTLTATNVTSITFSSLVFLCSFYLFLDNCCKPSELRSPQLGQLLFGDISYKPISEISADLALKSQKIITEFKHDPEFKLTASSTIREFREKLKSLRTTLLKAEFENRLFKSRRMTTEMPENQKHDSTPALKPASPAHTN